MIRFLFLAAAVGLISPPLVSSADWAQTVGVVVASLLSLAGIVFTVVNSRRTAREQTLANQKSEEIAVDAAAYERARESYEASILQYQKQISDLTARVRQAEARANHAEERAEHAEQETRKTRARLTQLERAMADSDISVPPEATT